MKKKQRKYALVLSAGGFKTAFQVGALNFLQENWSYITGSNKPMHFNLIASVSGGALNGAMVSMNQLEELNSLWIDKIGKNGVNEIYTSDIIDTEDKSGTLKIKPDLPKLLNRLVPNFNLDVSFGDKVKMLFSKKKRKQVISRIMKSLGQEISHGLHRIRSIADNSPLRFKLNYLLDKTKITDTRFFCGFVSLDNGNYYNVEHSEFASNNDFIKGVLASTSMPIVWQPVPEVRFKKNDNVIVSRNNVDGGVRNISPLGDLIKQINQDAESEYTIIVINCHNDKMPSGDFSSVGVHKLAARSVYEIAFNEIFQNDIKHFEKVNNIISQTKAWDNEIALFNSSKQEIREYELIQINPSNEFDLGNPLTANQELINQRIQHGYEMANAVFNQRKK